MPTVAAVFESQGRALASASGGEWSWVEAPPGSNAAGLLASGYLRTHFRWEGPPGWCDHQRQGDGEPDNEDALLLSADSNIHASAEADDTASLHAPAGSGSSAIFSDVHVVLSPVYGQPVLLFNHSHAESGEPLRHDCVFEMLERRLPVSQATGPLGPVVSQQEHPVLGSPFYALHGCETSKMMRDVGHADTTARGYLLCWLSLVGPVRAHGCLLRRRSS